MRDRGGNDTIGQMLVTCIVRGAILDVQIGIERKV